MPHFIRIALNVEGKEVSNFVVERSQESLVLWVFLHAQVVQLVNDLGRLSTVEDGHLKLVANFKLLGHFALLQGIRNVSQVLILKRLVDTASSHDLFHQVAELDGQQSHLRPVGSQGLRFGVLNSFRAGINLISHFV